MIPSRVKPNEIRRFTEKWWPAALTLLIYISTVGFASLALVGMHEGVSWPKALIWQGILYAAWLPYLGIVWGLTHYLGLTGRLMAVLYGVTALYAVAHAIFCLMVDAHYLGQVFDLGKLWQRLPIDILMATAEAAAVAAVRGYRLSSEDRKRVAALQMMLDEARSLQSVKPAQYLLVSVASRRVRVDMADIEWLSAAGNYVVVNWEGREGLIRETLAAALEQLDPSVFVRAHRSSVVNLAKVKSAASLSDGGWVVTLESGTDLVVSRTYRDEVLSRLGR